MGATPEMVVSERGLDQLIAVLRLRGYRTLGPVVRDGAIVHGEVSSVDDLPRGWHDQQAPGHYRLDHGDDAELFGWAVGPASWKSTFFPPEEVAWKASVEGRDVVLTVPDAADGPVALVGVRPCELSAMATLDRVLAGGAVVDDRYAARRADAFVVAVECGSPSGTCFCTSMGTGPAAGPGYDLCLTELSEGDHRFLVQVGSPAGADLLDAVDGVPTVGADRAEREEILAGAASRMGRSLDTEGLAGLLEANIDHPRWDEVAERCLSCGNCTLVCPTCFCSDVRDVTDLTGTVERRRSWASCFDIEHSFIHGGSVHATTASRYRQWLTHKLSTWWDQFGESGCVGCGRCIAWCPVGIDLTEEAAAIRATSGTTAGELR
ncbi:MAG: 4Fe-4S dicluster domain-containing protein [Acidimicrobiales bacterium]|jgi:ferredoxin